LKNEGFFIAFILCRPYRAFLEDLEDLEDLEVLEVLEVLENDKKNNPKTI